MEEGEVVVEDVSTDIKKKRMASILKRDLSRYSDRKVAVIVRDDYVVEAIWVREGGRKLLYEVDVELYDRDVIESVLKDRF